MGERSTKEVRAAVARTEQEFEGAERAQARVESQLVANEGLKSGEGEEVRTTTRSCFSSHRLRPSGRRRTRTPRGRSTWRCRPTSNGPPRS